MLGPITNPKNENVKDMNLREIIVMAPLIAGCFWIGLYPKPCFDILEPPTIKLVERLDPDYFSRNAAEQADEAVQLSRLLPVRDSSERMMDAITFTLDDFHVLKPAIILCLFGCGILLTDAFLVRRTGKRWLNAVTALAGEGVVAAVLMQYLPEVRSGGALSGLGGVDPS